MHFLVGLIGALIIVVCLVDGFEAMVLPRRVARRYRPTRMFYRGAWACWRSIGCRLPVRRRGYFLSMFGPLSLLILFSSWVYGLIFGFGLVHWAERTELAPLGAAGSLPECLYLSGTTFFTLGYGDVTPTGALGRVLAVIESGLGFGFMAVIIGYLPVLYQAFSRREQVIALLDARAGSPPTALALVDRMSKTGELRHLDTVLLDWERWAADLLESHLSFPVLSFYRSQHDNQSWLAALATILDTCTLIIATAKERESYQAQLTFAAARHAAVDISLVFWVPPRQPPDDRLTPAELSRVHELLAGAAAPDLSIDVMRQKVEQLREMYEPFLAGLANHLLFQLPRFHAEKATKDNWQSSAWMKQAAGIGDLPKLGTGDHFVDV